MSDYVEYRFHDDRPAVVVQSNTIPEYDSRVTIYFSHDGLLGSKETFYSNGVAEYFVDAIGEKSVSVIYLSKDEY